jgi:arylsulfatase A-like enzyme
VILGAWWQGQKRLVMWYGAAAAAALGRRYTTWETDARIPLIIHAPHKPATWGTRQKKALVEHVDLYPTISALAGIPVTGAESIEGSSYAALFDDAQHAVASSPAFQAAYTQYPRCNKGKSMPIDILQNSRCASVPKQDFK